MSYVGVDQDDQARARRAQEYRDKDEFVYDFYERYQRLPSLVEIDQWKRDRVGTTV